MLFNIKRILIISLPDVVAYGSIVSNTMGGLGNLFLSVFCDQWQGTDPRICEINNLRFEFSNCFINPTWTNEENFPLCKQAISVSCTICSVSTSFATSP